MNNITLVKINEAKITDKEKIVIGTYGLATCSAVLLYSKTKKKAIVAHISVDFEDTIIETLNLIEKNHLDEEQLEYKIIKGTIDNKYEIDKYVENFYKSKPLLFRKMDIEEESQINKETNSKEFLFDANTGKFVTNEYNMNEVIENCHNLSIKI